LLKLALQIALPLLMARAGTGLPIRRVQATIIMIAIKAGVAYCLTHQFLLLLKEKYGPARTHILPGFRVDSALAGLVDVLCFLSLPDKEDGWRSFWSRPEGHVIMVCSFQLIRGDGS
jgi:hypothetical protein